MTTAGEKPSSPIILQNLWVIADDLDDLGNRPFDPTYALSTKNLPDTYLRENQMTFDSKEQILKTAPNKITHTRKLLSVYLEYCTKILRSKVIAYVEIRSISGSINRYTSTVIFVV